jgi:hypothetical protein
MEEERNENVETVEESVVEEQTEQVSEQEAYNTPVEETPEVKEEPAPAPVVEKPKSDFSNKKGILSKIIIVIAVLAVVGFAVWFVLGMIAKNSNTEKVKTVDEMVEEYEKTKATKKTKEQIKELFSTVFRDENGIAHYMNASGIGSFRNSFFINLFGKDVVNVQEMGLDENQKFELCVDDTTKTSGSTVKKRYDYIFGAGKFDYDTYTTNNGFFTCTYDDGNDEYKCESDGPTGGLGSASGIIVKYDSFEQIDDTIELNLLVVSCEGDICSSIKEGTKLEGFNISKPFDETDESSKDNKALYTYKATFEIDGDGYQLIEVKPVY